MASYTYERLSAQDLSFLLAESANTPMHVGALGIFEAGPLGGESGGVDIDRYRRSVESVLHWIPRYRQKILWTPIDRWAFWVDDRHFEIGYHVRHLSLPRPGSLAQLKELASRLLAQQLDLSRPLWEIWVIEGLEGGEQFALLTKIHHCMLDGAAGADLSQILFSPSPKVEDVEPVPYLPRPEPSLSELMRDTVAHRAQQPLRALRSALDWVAREDTDIRGEIGRQASALGGLASWALQPASDTPINGTLGPLRAFDWFTMPLDDVRELRRVLGCTINDIVLGTVTGAIRRYLFRRRVDPASLDFRVSAPVNVRTAEQANELGNHVSSWILPLPLGVEDPLEQIDVIAEHTRSLKDSDASLGVQTMMSAAEWMPAELIKRGVGAAQASMNMIVTNVPGPQFPLFAVGARLLGLYPVVPLLPGGGLGIALFSYEGKLCWGFNADRDLVPDPDAFAQDICVSFEILRQATVTSFLERRTGVPEPEELAAEAAASEASQASKASKVAVAPRRNKTKAGTSTRGSNAKKKPRRRRSDPSAAAREEAPTGASSGGELASAELH